MSPSLHVLVRSLTYSMSNQDLDPDTFCVVSWLSQKTVMVVVQYYK